MGAKFKAALDSRCFAEEQRFRLPLSLLQCLFILFFAVFPPLVLYVFVSFMTPFDSFHLLFSSSLILFSVSFISFPGSESVVPLGLCSIFLLFLFLFPPVSWQQWWWRRQGCCPVRERSQAWNRNPSFMTIMGRRQTFAADISRIKTPSALLFLSLFSPSKKALPQLFNFGYLLIKRPSKAPIDVKATIWICNHPSLHGCCTQRNFPRIFRYSWLKERTGSLLCEKKERQKRLLSNFWKQRCVFVKALDVFIHADTADTCKDSLHRVTKPHLSAWRLMVRLSEKASNSSKNR